MNKYLAQLEATSIVINNSPGMSDHPHKAVLDSIRGSFGCKRQLVKQFAEAFMQCKLPDPDQFFQRGEIIIPLKNTVNHDYPLGVPIIIIEGDVGMSAVRNDHGNSLCAKYGEYNRRATEQEIRDFYSKIKSNDVATRTLLRYMNQPQRIPYIE